MQKISILNSSHLKNAEHVEFYHNVLVAIDKTGAENLGLSTSQYNDYKLAVDTEQDIVNRSTGSVYTPEMQAMDKERDRLFKLVRHKLQSSLLEDESSPVGKLANLIEKYLLTKYGAEIVSSAYQEESALIRGFVLDVRNQLTPESIELIGITNALNDLETANNNFTDQYNERVTEQSVTTSELTKRLRETTEAFYGLLTLHFEYKSTSDTTEIGEACASMIAVINVLVRDANQRLETRLGRSQGAPEEEE